MIPANALPLDSDQHIFDKPIIGQFSWSGTSRDKRCECPDSTSLGHSDVIPTLQKLVSSSGARALRPGLGTVTSLLFSREGLCVPRRQEEGSRCSGARLLPSRWDTSDKSAFAYAHRLDNHAHDR